MYRACGPKLPSAGVLAEQLAHLFVVCPHHLAVRLMELLVLERRHDTLLFGIQHDLSLRHRPPAGRRLRAVAAGCLATMR
jgi:hypothetical protein